MMELQEIRDNSSDNFAFAESTDTETQQGSYEKGDSEQSNINSNFGSNGSTKVPENDTSMTNKSIDNATTNKNKSNTDDEYVHNSLVTPPSGKDMFISNDKCQDIYNLLAAALSMLLQIDEVQKKFIKENNSAVTLATLMRHYKVTHAICVMEDVIRTISQLGNYEGDDDEEYDDFFNNPVWEKIQEGSRRAYDITEQVSFCEKVTENMKMEKEIGNLMSSLSDLLDSITVLFSENSKTKSSVLLKIQELLETVKTKLISKPGLEISRPNSHLKFISTNQ